jgi:hypothetical protein
MENEQIIEDRFLYYTDNFNIQRMNKYCMDREITIIDRKDNYYNRCQFITTNTYLHKIIKMFDIIKNPERNLYISSASYSEFPNFKLKPNGILRTDYFFNFVKNKISHYDLLIDFDVKNENERGDVLKEFEYMKQEFKKRNIAFYSMPSGNGYHIILDKLNLPLELVENKLILYEKYGKDIKESFNLKYYDLKNLGIWNRLTKMPYSMVLNKVCEVEK